MENVENVKANAFTHVDITRLGGRLSRSCKGAGSCDFVKELGPAAVKELRFTGAAIRSCARICQGAGDGSWKKFSLFLFFPFHYSTLCDFCQGAAYPHIWNICSIFSKRKSPRSWQAPGVCGILWPSPHGLGHFIWSPWPREPLSSQPFPEPSAHARGAGRCSQRQPYRGRMQEP